MDRHYRSSTRVDRISQSGRVEVMSLRVWFHETYLRSHQTHRERSREVGVRGDYDLRPFSNVISLQTQHQSFQAVGHTDTVFDADVGGKLILEKLDLLSQDVPTTGEDLAHSSIDLRLQLQVGRAQFKKRNSHLIPRPRISR